MPYARAERGARSWGRCNRTQGISESTLRGAPPGQPGERLLANKHLIGHIRHTCCKLVQLQNIVVTDAAQCHQIAVFVYKVHTLSKGLHFGAILFVEIPSNRLNIFCREKELCARRLDHISLIVGFCNKEHALVINRIAHPEGARIILNFHFISRNICRSTVSRFRWQRRFCSLCRICNPIKFVPKFIPSLTGCHGKHHCKYK
jgi:hypothetical protein